MATPAFPHPHPPPPAAKDVPTKLCYLRKDELYARVKPYALLFSSAEIPPSNLKTEVQEVVIEDVRGREAEFTFSKQGWAIFQLESAMEYEDFEDQEKIDGVHSREICLAVLEFLKPWGAVTAQVIDTTIRRTNATYPDSAVDLDEGPQPAIRVHVDATPQDVIDAINTIHKDKGAELQKKRYMYLNIWKPLKGPVRQWPLAICDANSVSPEDITKSDMVLAASSRENIMISFNPKHKWRYLSGQMPFELWVFKQVDSMEGQVGCVPHTAFQVPLESGVFIEPRESIETRVIVFFDK